MMFAKATQFLFGTLRGRLITGVALVHAVMMALFITDLTARQRIMLLDHQAEHAASLAKTLAASAAGWIAADDIAGLQELVEMQRQYPELVFALLTDCQGHVLADTDSTRRGLYLRDLPGESRQKLFSRTEALVDVATPAIAGGRHVGWARVGIGQKSVAARLADITRDGVFYALAAIVIGSFIAWIMGVRISGRLHAVQKTIDAIGAGDRSARATVTGNDEAAVMAREFNTMLDQLDERDAALRVSEERFRMVFENSPVSIWEEDFSGVGALLDELRRQGVSDIEAYFDGHPEAVEQCAHLARIVNINRAALALHGAASKEELFAGLVNTFTPDSFATFRQELVCLWNGGTTMVRDAEVKTLSGEPRQVTVYFSVCPGYEETFGKVLVSLADITERKRAEEALHLQTVELEDEVAERQMAQESLQEKALLLEEEIDKHREAQEELERLNENLEERVRERTGELVAKSGELEQKNRELERMNKIFVGRELRMVELKKRIRELEQQHLNPEERLS